jgi:hypothetical protein
MSTNSGSDDVYVATRTAHIDVNGRRERITKGQTRVRAGHPLLKQYSSFFKPAGEGVKFDTEDAVDRPAARNRRRAAADNGPKPTQSPTSKTEGDGTEAGEGGEAGQEQPPGAPAPVKPYSEWSKSELKDEIKRRNADGRADEKKITGFSRASQDTLAELLAQDDPVPVESGFVETPDGTDVVISPNSPDGVTPEDHSEGALDGDTDEDAGGDGDDA